MIDEEKEIINVGVAGIIKIINFFIYSILSFILLVLTVSTEFVAIIFTFPIFVWCVCGYLDLISNRYIVTNKNIIHKYGIIMKNTEEIRLSKIEKINVKNAGIIGTLFGYGTLEMSGTGTSSVNFTQLDNPNKIKEIIQTEIEKYEEEK